MRKEMRWAAMAAVVLCGTTLAFGQEAKTEKAPEGKKQEAAVLINERQAEVKALKDRANEINKSIGELASSGKLTQGQEAVDQMKRWVDDPAKINERLAQIEQEIAGIREWISGQKKSIPVLEN